MRDLVDRACLVRRALHLSARAVSSGGHVSRHGSARIASSIGSLPRPPLPFAACDARIGSITRGRDISMQTLISHQRHCPKLPGLRATC
jgi:hypothetical protein